MKNDGLEEIYREYYPMVYRYLFILCGNGATAQDLTQDTFLKSMIHLDECDYATVKSWLFRVAHNLFIDSLKKRGRYEMKSLEESDDIEDTLDLAGTVLSDMNYKRLLTIINALPQNQKMAVLLCDVTGIEQSDAARIMGLSGPAYRNLLLRARRKLRDTIKEEMKNE